MHDIPLNYVNVFLKEYVVGWCIGVAAWCRNRNGGVLNVESGCNGCMPHACMQQLFHNNNRLIIHAAHEERENPLYCTCHELDHAQKVNHPTIVPAECDVP